MHNAERAVKILSTIKALGVRLAIDDFGTGYSSLAHLKRFPIDTLKVDRSFIREIPSDAEDRAIAEAIIAMGKTLSLTVVAEGVETPEQQSFLQRARVRRDAGLLLQHARPAGRVRELARLAHSDTAALAFATSPSRLAPRRSMRARSGCVRVPWRGAPHRDRDSVETCAAFVARMETLVLRGLPGDRHIPGRSMKICHSR